MSRALVGGVAFVVLAAVIALRDVEGQALQHRAVLDTYCVTCHSDRLRTAGLSLESLDLSRPDRAPDVWEKVVGKLRG
ncbi:MAG: hypothetical protein HY655_15140, partial [Acidobacteria bacterium]|nr:hypothetical protein [Acidobacteriota bacterium]